MSPSLRPYQLDAVEGIRQKFRERSKRVLCIAPTGAGKTILFSHIAAQSAAKNSRVLVIAHRRELIQQTCDKLAKFGVRHGVIMNGIRPAPQQSVQVASIQTLIARPNAVSQVDLIVIDEAHHTTLKNGYSKVLGWFPHARVLGVTATPWRLDGQGLGDVFDGHVIASTPRQLRDEGFLVPVGGWEYEAIDTSAARVKGGDFVVGDLQAQATSAKVVGDVVSEWLEHAKGMRTILFALSIKHSQHMVAAFRAAGIEAEHVDGEMPTTERDAVLRRLRAGTTQVVCNCNVLTEGFDCPELECCILARPTLSVSLYLQMVGRVLRPSPGKALARIHDHAGCLAAHGHPFAERDYNPEHSAKKSKKEAEEKVPRENRCPNCKSVVAFFPCDACGYQPKPEELELDPAPAAAKREIEHDGRGPVRKVDDDLTRAKTWAREFSKDDERKRAFFSKMVERHGLDKGQRVYWWFSGKVARPRMEWVEEERIRLAEGRQRTNVVSLSGWKL